MTSILGISAYYHDSAAALIVDGQIVAAAQEERFTRKKHDYRFPENAIDFCLTEANLTAESLNYVSFYDKPILKFGRLLETYLGYAPRGFSSFLRAMPLWLKEKLHLPREIRRGLGGHFKKRLVFTTHHESHAASAFYPSPFDEAAIVVVDGVGEWASASIGVGQGRTIKLEQELRFPHSLGLLYSAFTYYCGFQVNSGEYKLMGLAPYGQPKYADLILRHLVDLKPDGSFRMDMSYFNYCAGLTMTNAKFDRLFGQRPRGPETPINEFHKDIAASIQAVTETIMFRIAEHAQAITQQKNLCLAGGVALNCVANGRILREGPFEQMWIQPAAGDAGGALGAAQFVWHQLLGKPRTTNGYDSQQGSLLGPAYSSDAVLQLLRQENAVYRKMESEDELCSEVASLIAAGKVVGWMQGRMEFGPRALGARSILGDPRSPEMQSHMNRKIKFRESFRPFAPVTLEHRVGEYFEVPEGFTSPYMLLVAPVKSLPAATKGADQTIGESRPKTYEIPAVTHVDQSARVQTVSPQHNQRFHKLLTEFERQSGCPVIINTSFNIRGEPIVCSPADAYRCFMGTNMDVLAIEDYVLLKEQQPQRKTFDLDDYRESFPLD